MGQAPEGEDGTTELPRELRFLKTLVTVLTLAMIAGVITITGLLVIRLNADPAPVGIDPGRFALPDGVTLTGISLLEGRAVLVSDDGVIRVFDAGSGALLQEIPLDP